MSFKITLNLDILHSAFIMLSLPPKYLISLFTSDEKSFLFSINS